MQQNIRHWLEDGINLRQKVLGDKAFLTLVEEAGRVLVEQLRAGHKVLLCGNGGSAADAQHIAAELIIRYKSKNERHALPALALTTDSSVLTACANDYSFNDVFSRQVSGLGQAGDVLIAFSTSGNSPNILAAVAAAQEKNMKIIKMLGAGGGKLAHTPGMNIIVPSDITARVQEIHITIGHIFCEMIDMELFGFSA